MFIDILLPIWVTLMTLSGYDAILSDQNPTPETIYMYNKLKHVTASNQIMFGHQGDTLYGLYGGHSPYNITAVHNDGIKSWKFTVRIIILHVRK